MSEPDGTRENPLLADNPLPEEDTKIFFSAAMGQLKIGPVEFHLSGIEIDFIVAGLQGDRKSLGTILTELRKAHPGFYKCPERIERGEIVEAIEMVIRRHPEIIKDPIASIQARLLSKHPVELSGKMVGPGEVIVAFEHTVSGEDRADVGPVSKLEAINIFRKLPVNIQRAIKSQYRESVPESGRYLVKRCS